MGAIAILPLDRGSLVVPTPDTPNIVLKHTDGDLIRLQPADDDSLELSRRDEAAVTWWGHETYASLEEGVLAAADMQGFSARRGGEPSDIFELDVTETLPTATLELEPLDLGGFVVDDRSHLPLVFHMIEGDYWRIAMDPRGDGFRLEYRADDVSSWETIEEYDGIGAVDAIPSLLDATPIPYTTDATATSMQDLIESTGTDFVTETPDHLPDDLVDQAAVQSKRLDWDS